MLSVVKALAYPIISLILMILGTGLFTTFISVRLDMAGASDMVIGIVSSAFYAGVLAGSLRSLRWIARFGHLRSLVALCAAQSAVILLHALWLDPIYWGILRLLSGLIMGALFVIIESWFLLISDSSNRGQSLSLYLFIFYLALSLGQQLLNLADPYSLLPYCLASTLSSLAILPIVIGTTDAPTQESSKRFSLLELFRTSPSGFFGGIVSGMLLASVYGLAPVYGQKIGLTLSDVATLMSIIVFGGVALQWPLGKWADRSSRRGVLILACLASAFFAMLVGAMESPSWPLRLTLVWLFGGFSFVLYPLSMAFTCEKLQENQIVGATGGFVLSYGIGAITGPLLAPLFMEWMGAGGLFYFLSLICLFLGLIAAAPLIKRAY